MKPLYRLLLFSPVLICLGIGMGAGVDVFRNHLQIAALQSGKLDAREVGEKLLAKGKVSQASKWIETANLISARSSADDEMAIDLLETALDVDGGHPDAWALLSFLHTRQSGEYTAASERALRASMDACPYCNKDLLKWRFTYVLQHWEQVSEPTRMAAFSGADFLRWWHLEYEYLGRLRRESLAQGIPFDTYREKVGTHVRPNEI